MGNQPALSQESTNPELNMNTVTNEYLAEIFNPRKIERIQASADAAYAMCNMGAEPEEFRATEVARYIDVILTPKFMRQVDMFGDEQMTRENADALISAYLA